MRVHQGFVIYDKRSLWDPFTDLEASKLPMRPCDPPRPYV
jgi:hypothetical protein